MTEIPFVYANRKLLKPPFTDSYSQPREPLILNSILIVSFQLHLGNRN